MAVTPDHPVESCWLMASNEEHNGFGDAHLADFFGPDRSIRTDVTPVTRLMREYLVEREENDTSHHRDDSVWHASTLNREWCARYSIIHRMTPLGLRMPSFSGPDSQLIFDIGHAMHAWWQNKYLGPQGILWGQWVCSHCGASYVGMGLDACPECGVSARDERYPSRGLVYVEPTVALELPFKWAVGHIDGIGFDKIWSVWELKTLNPFAWSKLEAPYPNHVDQAMLYLHALKIHPHVLLNAYGVPDTSLPYDPADLLTFRIVYINKSTGKPKEFVLDYDAEHAASIIEKVVKANRLLQQYTEGSFDNELPSRCDGCERMSSARAKKCSLVQFCFNAQSVADVVDLYEGEVVEVAARTNL